MVATLETRYDWAYNEIVTPTDMNALGQTASALRLPDIDAAYLTVSNGAVTSTTFSNVTNLSCQLTLSAQSRIRFFVGLRYTNSGASQRDYFTVQYASSLTPSVYTNTFHGVFSGEGSASTDGWIDIVDVNTTQLAVNFVGITPSLAAGTWILRPAFRSASGSVNVLLESYMLILGTV